MSKITFVKNQHRTNPNFRDTNIKGYYCFGPFKGVDYFEICTTSKDENDIEGHHYRQVIDIDREAAIELVKLLKTYFKI